jgi:hypothetical protein
MGRSKVRLLQLSRPGADVTQPLLITPSGAVRSSGSWYLMSNEGLLKAVKF